MKQNLARRGEPLGSSHALAPLVLRALTTREDPELKLRRIVGSLLTLGISGALAIGAGVLPATAEENDPAYEWVLSPADAIIQPGESVTYTATLVDENGEPVDPQPAAPFIGTDAAGDIEDGMTITAFSVGPRAVMAVSVVDGSEYFGSTSLTVADAIPAAPAPPAAADPSESTDAPRLAETGVDPLLGGIAAGGLLLVGLASVLIVRRRSAMS